MAKRRTAVADGPTDTPPDINGEPVHTSDAATEVAVVNPTPQNSPPEPTNGNHPVETFSVPCGNGAYIQASVWGKQIQYEGRMITVYSVTVRKSYKDTTTQEWKNTQSFRGSELYCVHHVLSCAGTWIMNQRTESSCPF